MIDKTSKFVHAAQVVHGLAYDYSKTLYVHCMHKVVVTCPTHGDFLVSPNKHLGSKQGCIKCSKKYRPTTDEFVESAKTIHGEKYDYSRVQYINNRTRVQLTCPEHGIFSLTPSDHISKSQGCPTCGRKRCGAHHRRDTEWFVGRANEIHTKRYDYTKVEYKSIHVPVEIICTDHGSFMQSPASHIHQKAGCPTCSVRDYEGGYGHRRFENHPEIKTNSAKLYLVECYNETERFVKIGITQRDVHYRFRVSNRLPYEFNTITLLTGQLYELFLVEQDIKKMFKRRKYTPLLKFNGYTECFDSNAAREIVDAIGICFIPGNK